MLLNLMLSYLGRPFVFEGYEYQDPCAAMTVDKLNREITDVCVNSAQVTPGAMFVAIKGFTADGHNYIGDAIAKGAVAVMAEKETPVPENVALLVVKDTREGLSAMAGAINDFPAAKMTVIGVTGTNGKTTTVNLLANMLETAGFNTGVITTINWRYGGKVQPSSMTTPDAVELQKNLREMYEAGVTHVVMEVSSHAIDLSRIAHCYFDVAAFTNLSQDHLDHHGTMQAYGEVKKRLFTDYLRRMPKGKQAVAVINATHAFGREIFEDIEDPKISVAVEQAADVVLDPMGIDIESTKARITVGGEKFFIESPLIGGFNQENLVTAAGVGLALKLNHNDITRGLNTLKLVKGRLERVATGRGYSVFVDYAHTPDALENVLRTLKGLKPRRLLCVFGCGGNRDKTKRPLMGAVAVQYSDFTVVTSDNPRNEEPAEIINDILAGITPEVNFAVEPDRAKAIQLAIRQASSGDIVLIAGKGHENYQIIKGQTFHFDDVEQALLAAEKNYEPLDLDA